MPDLTAPEEHRPVQPARDAALWIALLLQQFPELGVELAPGRGTGADPASGSRPDPDPARAARIRAERRDALLVEQRYGLAVPGYGAAPIRLHISDTIRDITDGVVELEEAVHAKLGLPLPRRAGVTERLRRLGTLLDDIGGHPVLARHTRDELRRMARRCSRALGDTEQVVRVSGRCPWCDSVSLRAFPDRGAVLCVNPACRCADDACGCHDDPAYRHLWAEADRGALAGGATGRDGAGFRLAPAAPVERSAVRGAAR